MKPKLISETKIITACVVGLEDTIYNSGKKEKKSWVIRENKTVNTKLIPKSRYVTAKAPNCGFTETRVWDYIHVLWNHFSSYPNIKKYCETTFQKTNSRLRLRNAEPNEHLKPLLIILDTLSLILNFHKAVSS